MSQSLADWNSLFEQKILALDETRQAGALLSVIPHREDWNEFLESVKTEWRFWQGDSRYRTTYPDIYSTKRVSVDNAVKEVQRIYQTYFFPEMKTNWNTHPNNIGHRNFQGCFRCHDGQHFSQEGQLIRNECNICHITIDQTFGGKTIIPKEGKFQHPVNLGDRGAWLCATCHKGDKAFTHPLNLGDISKFQCAECHKGDKLKEMLGNGK